MKSSHFYETREPTCPIPIERFKTDPDIVFPNKLFKLFRSSGTTEASRSFSWFSKDGLELYRRGSLLSFYGILENFFPEPVKAEGISMIPSTKEWTDSSLAQMVEWIAEISPVTYCETAPKSDSKPCWIFGTGFHFVDLYDRGYRSKLPKGAIVIETGGTKGKTREVSRAQLHEMIRTMFKIKDDQIVSEYGMAELACQAYEFKRPECTKPKHFVFPNWVKIGVQRDNNDVHASGEGSLVIDDPTRIDVTAPIRTQDFVELKNQTFVLKGRLPNTQLKGCSLHLSEIIAKNNPEKRIDSPALPKALPSFNRAEFVDWIQKDEVKGSLLDSLLTDQIVDLCINDLINDLPSSDLAFNQILRQRIEVITHSHWLIISPQTHPIAVLYPIMVGLYLGRRLTVRPGRNSLKFFQLLREFVKGNGLDFTVLSPSYRLSNNPSDFDAALVFGSDETLHALTDNYKLAINGFGTKLAVSLTSSSSFVDDWTRILKDIIAIANVGCRSSRAIFFEGNPSNEIKSVIKELILNTSIPALPLKYRIRSFQLVTEAEYPVQTKSGVCFYFVDYHSKLDLDLLMAGNQFVIPIILYDFQQKPFIDHYLSNHRSIQIIGSSITGPKHCEHGSLNRVPWSTKIDGRELFY